jgi:hypothetical protein
MEEVMEVLKLCVVQGVPGYNLGVPILAEELATLRQQAGEASMADFAAAARLDQAPPDTAMSSTVAGKKVAVFNVDGVVYAMEGSRLHK